MEIKGTNVNLNQKIKEDSQAGKKLAKEMMLFADDNGAAVSLRGFQEKLDKMSKLSTQDLIKFIRGFDKDESVIELIVDEVGSSKDERKEACKKVLSALTNKAKELGIDTKDFEQQFIKELNYQFNSWGTVNTEKLDKIINAITQSIENRQNFTAEDVQTVQNTPAAEGQEQANGVIENRLEKAYSAFGERVGEDGEMTDVEKVLINKATGEKTEVKYKDGQMQRDGIAADIADGVKKIFGSENTASKIRSDLKASNAQLQQLKEAKLQGEDAYKAKFKEIFGVEYDYANMVACQKAEQTYINASTNHEFEMMFNRTLKTLLSPAPLREEVRYDNPDPMTNMVITTVTATKSQVYSREFNNLAEFLTQKDSNGNEIKGSEILNAALAEKGVANGTIEEKFEVLKQIAKTLSKELHTATLEAGGGKEFSEVQAMYDNSYKAAYGVENDIMKRVTDYNVSQEIGGAVTKIGAILITTLATAGFGGGLVATAAATSIATVGYEVIDRGTSGNALNALREQGLGEYLKTVGEDVDWEATLKQAAMSGGAVLIGGGVAQGVTAIMKGSSSVAQFAAMLGADVVTDATMELFTTKQITWQNMVFTVLLSTIGNAAQLNQMKKAADAVDPAKIAQKHSIADIEQQLADIDVKRTLTQNADEIANLTTQRKLYESALDVKKANEGLKMLSEDGVKIKLESTPYEYHDHYDHGINPGYARIETKSGYYDYKHFSYTQGGLEAPIARQYYDFKMSGLDIDDYTGNNKWLFRRITETPEEALNSMNNTIKDFRMPSDREVRFNYQGRDLKFSLEPSHYGQHLKEEDVIYGLKQFLHDNPNPNYVELDKFLTLALKDGTLDDIYTRPFWSKKLTTYKSDPFYAAQLAPSDILKPSTADNISGQGISFKQAAGQPDYSATRIEWGRTVEETIALNKKNGINLELVKGDDGQYFLGIKDIWTDGYHRVDRNSVVMHYGDYAPTPENYVAANPEWAKANANPDGTVKDCAVVANDTGAKILENSYVTADGQKIDFATMEPGTKVHKDPNAVVNAVAYDRPQTLHTLEGDITTDVTMGDVDGNVYNNFKQLKKQITKGQLVANDADPYSARFIELVKAGQDDEAIKLLKQVTKSSVATKETKAVMQKSVKDILKPSTADNISGQGISFKQAAGQPDYSATRIEWGRTVEETIALNKKNGVNLELVQGDDGEFFLGIKDIWSDGYHRVDRNSVVMHYGDYAPTPENYVAANPEWVKANANPDGTVKDCAVVANDTGARILENSYVTADGQKIDFATMAPGTKVHKDPNAIVNAVAYDSPQTLHTLEGDITTDVTMGDVDGNVYNNFKQLKKQITRGQLVANEADPYSARFIELVKAGQDDEAIKLLKSVTKMSQ